MQRVDSFRATDGSLHATKEKCAEREIMIIIQSDDGDEIDTYDVAKLVGRRRKVIEILEWVDMPEVLRAR